MKPAMIERIGNPVLFSGRKEELSYFLQWINGIKEEKSRSTAILARRKMGKTAIMERLFNITFQQNNGVIPFYYEIREGKVWALDFCKDFFLTFFYQYVAFKTRKKEYLSQLSMTDFKIALDVAKREGLDYLCDLVSGVAYAYAKKEVDVLWKTVREAPKKIAALRGEFIVQMIDEFQFFNSEICWDKAKKNIATDMVGGYLSTAESKVAPLLVSGSWVGWLMNLLTEMLPSRFRFEFLGDLPENEAIEMIYNYSRFFDVPVTEESAYVLNQLSEGSPFYISSIICSRCPGKDLTTIEGVTKTLEFETLDNRGVIKTTWFEYIASALPRINDKNGKSIVLYLCQNRDREISRDELMSQLNLNMTDSELEKKLKALIKSDIIAQGQTNFDYRGVSDNIFDKVFRGIYEKEISRFDIKTIGREYDESAVKYKNLYLQVLGKFNYMKGYFAEYVILDRLRVHGKKDNTILKSFTRYLPGDFNFCEYSQVWKYNSSRVYSKSFNVDIYAVAANKDDYSIVGEVKNRDLQKFTLDDVLTFLDKFEEIKRVESLEKVVGFIFSRKGFTEEADAFCKEKGNACSEDEGWLD